MELDNGRPLDASGRLPKELRCYDLLDSLGLPYQRVDHAPAMTMEACSAIDAVLQAGMCKNLLLCNRQCTSFYLLMILGDKHFKTSQLSRQIGSSRLSFADGKYMEEFLDITPGSLSVMGLMNDRDHRVKLLIDEDVLKEDFVCFHPCINTSSLKVRTRDLLERLLPAMGHEAAVVTLTSE